MFRRFPEPFSLGQSHKERRKRPAPRVDLAVADCGLVNEFLREGARSKHAANGKPAKFDGSKRKVWSQVSLSVRMRRIE
jgi:hypothetical protein